MKIFLGKLAVKKVIHYWGCLTKTGRILVAALLIIIVLLLIQSCTLLAPWRDLAIKSSERVNDALIEKVEKETERAEKKLND